MKMNSIQSSISRQAIFKNSHPPVFQTWNEKLVLIVPFSLVWVDIESGNYAEAFRHKLRKSIVDKAEDLFPSFILVLHD
jgi:hypothetical protein